MSNLRIVLEKAVRKAKDMKVEVEYKHLEEDFFYLKISSELPGGKRDYIFLHEPYESVKGMSVEKITEKIKKISEHDFSKFL